MMETVNQSHVDDDEGSEESGPAPARSFLIISATTGLVDCLLFIYWDQI